SDQHLVADCPVPANVNSEVSVNNNNNRHYSCRVSASNVLDSGSSSHHNNNRDSFDSLSPAGDATVSLADGSDVKIRGIGNVHLRTDRGPFLLKDAKFTPEFSTNLISVSKLTEDGYMVVFDRNQATVLRN